MVDDIGSDEQLSEDRRIGVPIGVLQPVQNAGGQVCCQDGRNGLPDDIEVHFHRSFREFQWSAGIARGGCCSLFSCRSCRVRELKNEERETGKFDVGANRLDGSSSCPLTRGLNG